MASNKNIFCVSNPDKILDGLWSLIDGCDLVNTVIFLPSRRSVRSVTKMLVEKMGDSVLLPELVPLGEEAIDLDLEIESTDIITNMERIILLSKLLGGDNKIKNLSNALPLSLDLLRMQDYLENENINSRDINWMDLVDEKYANHFRDKAKFLDILTRILPTLMGDKLTSTQSRNAGIKKWKNVLSGKDRVIVCGSTASVPATSELMEFIANLSNGYILLPGKISGEISDFELDTNPYNNEYKFLKKISVNPGEVNVIDVGQSDIDLFNMAFGNSGDKSDSIPNAELIETESEQVEASIVAEIAKRAASKNKTVLVITPDAAANQRIATELEKYNIAADFSGGASGNTSKAGRSILNFIDDCVDEVNPILMNEYQKSDFDLFKTLSSLYEMYPEKFQPEFDADLDDSIAVWSAIQTISNLLIKYDIVLTAGDIRSVISYALTTVSIRPQMNDAATVKILGTVESRMQTADIVILTGLNEGMFPALGYENPWLPKKITEKIGLPPATRKVSLMSLDFMNLSCGDKVFWTRSKVAGGATTTESRFLSRLRVSAKDIKKNTEYLDIIKNQENIKYNPLDYSAPTPPANNKDLYVTDLELLIHNPYSYYARKILRLRPVPDYWQGADMRDFGNIVHNVIENGMSKSAQQILSELKSRAEEVLERGSVILHFWNKRFADMAPVIVDFLNSFDNDISFEIDGFARIAGRNVRARADLVVDGMVIDVKTGAAPNEKQLMLGNMPQLPIEAYMLKTGGFDIKNRTIKSNTPVIKFLQLQNNKIDVIDYTIIETDKMIMASIDKVSQLLGQYSKDFTPYEYYENKIQKYHEYADLARRDD